MITFFQLTNTYYIQRHGQSIANQEGLIVSNPDIGTLQYGLTDKGRTQVHETITSNSELDNNTLIYTSDFKRATETARISQEVINAPSINHVHNLRERYFGELDLKDNSNYKKVWIEDKKDPEHCRYGAESVVSVLRRMITLIESIENAYSGKKILLVSHGDPLQILMTYFKGKNPQHHRQTKHLEVAEIRKIQG